MSRVSRKHLIADTLAAFQAAGCAVKGARICDNGDVLLLTEAPAGALPANDETEGDWTDLAGQKDTPRAERS